MANGPNDALNKVLLGIDQVSQLTGVKKNTIRYWEKEFSEYLSPVRTESNRRQYSLDDLSKVEQLKHLIEEEKYKTMGVRMKLGLMPNSAGGGKEDS